MFTKSQIDVSGFSIKDDKDGKNKIIHLTWVLKIHDNSEWSVNKLKYWDKLSLVKRKNKHNLYYKNQNGH